MLFFSGDKNYHLKKRWYRDAARATIETRSYSESDKGNQEPRRGIRKHEEEDARADLSSRDLDQGRNGHGSQEPERGNPSPSRQTKHEGHEAGCSIRKSSKETTSRMSLSPHYKKMAEATSCV